MSNVNDTSGIPEEFWSEYTERPFQECIECEQSLVEGTVPYAIQKHIVAGETVFEMAICMECASRLQAGFSVESRQALIEFIRDAPERERRHEAGTTIDDIQPMSLEKFDDQLARIQHDNRVRLEHALACCAVCGKLRTECHRYSMGTACLSQTLLSAAPDADNLGSPFLICEDCELQMSDCISQTTRDAWNRFVEDNFDGPPSLSVDPKELVAIF